MTISYRNSSKATQASGGTSTLSVSVPAGTINGDIMVLFAGPEFNTFNLTDPAGWTALSSVSTNGSYGMKSYYRVASSEPGSYTLTWASNAHDQLAVIVTLENPDPTTPYDSTAGNTGNNNGSTSNPVATAITTTHANEMVVGGFHFKNAGTFSAPANISNIAQNASASASFSLVVCYGLQAAAGTTGTEQATLGTASVCVVELSAYNSSLITPQFWTAYVKCAEVDQ